MSLADLAESLQGHQPRAAAYSLYTDYLEGRHQLRYANQQLADDVKKVVESLRENLCPAVVDAFVDGMTVRSWGDAADQATAEGLDRLVPMVNRGTLGLGDGFVLVWAGRDGKPQPMYHPASQIIPTVDPDAPDQLSRAIKIWHVAKRWRANIYYADHVERYVTTDEMPAAAPAPEKPESWVPYASEDADAVMAHAFGSVPVCWWKHRPPTQTAHGVSILVDVIPLQDALNKSIADMVVNGEAYGRPFWYLLNYRSNDPLVNPLVAAQDMFTALRGNSKFDPTKGSIFTSSSEGPFGQLDPPDLTRQLAVQEGIAAKIARVVGIPTFYFSQQSGDVPSGESLRVLAMRRTNRIQAFLRESQPVWRGLCQLLGKETEPTWASPIPTDQTERYQIAALKKGLGYAMEDVIADLDEPDPQGVVARAAQAEARKVADMGKALRDGQIGF